MTHWHFLLGGVVLAAVPIVHYLITRRALAVSGRVTALVNRVADGPVEVMPEMDEDELAAALEAMALEAFGEEALAELEAEESSADADADVEDVDEVPALASTSIPPQATWVHAVFLLAIGVGGFIAAMTHGGVSPEMTMGSEAWDARFGGALTPLSIASLVIGGVCVGFGTRMSGGCTSGHGLCGLSRFQNGSMLATAAFFGTGIIVTVAINALVGS